MRAAAIMFGKLCAATLAAWMGGTMAFGVLVAGTWLYDATAMLLSPAAYQWVLLGSLWLCRGIVFVIVATYWVFPIRLTPRNG